MPHLKLTFFGAPQVTADGSPLIIPRRKVMALLVYLAITGQPQRRDKLATLFWPEARQQTARSALRRELAALKEAVGEESLFTSREEIALDFDADIWVDVHAFRQHAAACESNQQISGISYEESLSHCASAAQLYCDDFLSGFTLSDCPEFDDWQFFEADGLRREAANVLLKLVNAHRDRSEYETAIDFARRWMALDSMHEPVHRELMRLYALAGQQAAAVRQYDECVRILDEDLGVPPEEETTQLYEAIRTRVFPGKTTKGANDQLRTLAIGSSNDPVAKHNLPVQPTSFIGRKDELAAIRELLLTQEDCRLLTLIGSGGSGKTRLAIESALGLQEEFHDGLTFVGLASIASANAIVPAIADALELPLQGNVEPEKQLTDYLQSKQLLLVLDNFEHLQDGSALIGRLVKCGDGLKILATSREVLGLQEEWLYPVKGFATSGDDAIELFMQRARRANSSFVPNEQDLVGVVKICRSVDGLPLALELAATWVGTLTIEEIAEEIATDLDFLTTTIRDAPERHSSLRSVLEQTWRLLSEEEQIAFCKLATFRGGFTRQAAKRVTGISVMTLAALVRKSIISLNADGRYAILALLQQFASEKADAVLNIEMQQSVQMAEKHSRYYGMFIQALEHELLGTAHVSALRKIEQELENVRQGWRWVLPRLGSGSAREDTNLISLVDYYVEALFQFYDIRSRFQEGYTEFSRALTQFNALEMQSDILRQRVEIGCGRICGRLGWFAFQIGQPREAIQQLQRSNDMLQKQGADSERIFALNYLSAVYRHLHKYSEARRLLRESEEICRRLNDRFGLTVALNILGQIACEEGKYAEAEQYLSESLDIKRSIGDRRGITFSLLYLSTVAQAQGDLEKTANLLRQSIAISREHGDRRSIAIGLSKLAELELTSAHLEEAQELFTESLAIYSDIYNLREIIAIRIRLGDLASIQDEFAAAQQEYETALHLANDLQVSPKELDPLIAHPRQWLAQHT